MQKTLPNALKTGKVERECQGHENVTGEKEDRNKHEKPEIFIEQGNGGVLDRIRDIIQQDICKYEDDKKTDISDHPGGKNPSQ